jgi:hypothetical protein
VQFFPVQSNAAQLEAMRAGRLHIAAVNTGGNPIAVACAGFRPFAMMAAEDGSFGYEMEIITYPGSGIERSPIWTGGNWLSHQKPRIRASRPRRRCWNPSLGWWLTTTTPRLFGRA